jgi:hypothetical protein
MDGVESGYSAKTAGSLHYAPAELRVGMTRRGQLLFGRVATRMDGVKSGYSANTADPSTALLRSEALGRVLCVDALSERCFSRRGSQGDRVLPPPLTSTSQQPPPSR